MRVACRDSIKIEDVRKGGETEEPPIGRVRGRLVIREMTE